jgi:two-component system, sensor histidine kinase and response regulator
MAAHKGSSNPSGTGKGAGPSEHSSTSLPIYQELVEAIARQQEELAKRTVAMATAAHELQTPLAIIAGYVDLLLSQRAGRLNTRQRQILEDSQSNCARLRDFVTDFLDYSALENGKVPMYFELGDLNACLSEVFGYWLTRYQEKGIALYLPINSKLEQFAFDYHKVQQIVSNLLENSLKFTPAGGTVWLTADPYKWERRTHQASVPAIERRKEVGEVSNAARVTVCDTGPGIAAEFHQEIFQDFFRVPQSDKLGGGTGLGLAISRRLVQAHGGKVWVESEPGKGSKLCFLLPFVRT